MLKRIYLVDDHSVVRRGLRQLFEHEADFCVCGEASSVTQALSEISELAPDLVLSDLTLEGRSGLELVQLLAAHHPHIPVLIVSMHDEQLYAQRTLAAGARGYVMKRHADGEVIQAAREVLAGRIYASETVWERIHVGLHPNGVPPTPIDVLSDRELEVFLLIGQGFAPRHIAERLSLSTSTIEVHREHIKQKLGLESSPLLLRYAVRWCKDHDLA